LLANTPCPPDQILFYIQNKRALIAEGILKEDSTNSELKVNLQQTATQLLKAGAIAMDSKQQTFTVKANPVTYYEVKLFPKISCSCDDMRNGLCAHVLAVKLSLGINIEDDLRKYQPQRGLKTDMKNSVKKLKRESSVEAINTIQIKRSREGIPEEEMSMQSAEMVATTESDVEREQDGVEAVEVDPNSTEAQALLQTTLDEGQLHLMQIAAQSFRPEVGLNM